MTNKTNSIIKLVAGAIAAILLIGILVVLIQINASLKAQDTTANITDEVDIADSYNEDSANGESDEPAVTTIAEEAVTSETTTTTAVTEPETTTEATTTEAVTTTTAQTTTAATTTTQAATTASSANTSSSTGDIIIDTAGITDIEIDWYTGSVTVIAYDGSSIMISETDSDQAIDYTIRNGELKIEYYRSQVAGNVSDDLTIYIPATMSLDELSIEATTADVSITGGEYTFGMVELSVETTSGSITITDTDASNMSIDSTSGNISISDCAISFKLEIETTSGNATVVLLSGVGYTLEYETNSGTITAGGTALSGKGKTTVGNGEIKIDVETTSGDVTITS